MPIPANHMLPTLHGKDIGPVVLAILEQRSSVICVINSVIIPIKGLPLTGY